MKELMVLAGISAVIGVGLFGLWCMFTGSAQNEGASVEDVTDRRLYRFNIKDSRGLEEDVCVYTCNTCERSRMIHATGHRWFFVEVCPCRQFKENV